MRLACITPYPYGPEIPVAQISDQSYVHLGDLCRYLLPKLAWPENPDSLGPILPRILDFVKEFQEKLEAWNQSDTAETRSGLGWRTYEKPHQILPPIKYPPNFRVFEAFEIHERQTRAQNGEDIPESYYEFPAFSFSNTRSQVGNLQSIQPPDFCTQLDFGVNLGIVIGREASNVDAESAWDIIAGFTILNDFAARDLEDSERKIGLGLSKSRDFATAAGPVLVTRDEFEDRISEFHLDLHVEGRLNGRTFSQGNIQSLYYPIPYLIQQASRNATLYPGDLIATGPIGNGSIAALGTAKTGGWLKPGDYVEVSIERIGTLTNSIGAATS